MKLKNNDPGKIWAKSDHRFKSYGQKVDFCQNIFFGTVLEPGQLPGSRVPGILQLPGSGYPVLDKPSLEQFRQWDQKQPEYCQLQAFPAFFYFLLDFEPSKGILIDDIKL